MFADLAGRHVISRVLLANLTVRCWSSICRAFSALRIKVEDNVVLLLSSFDPKLTIFFFLVSSHRTTF